ncbi:N-acetyltransferase [Ectobacillus ponti]|uniref:N-acetyltransferase n=1 Tax=Ectobacillus ponti TaxID=2961894 RepID=A0AA42BQF8_9BACI|nr:N-acetyltransferase [Ectobacillus ponti]MCP8970255.1 N-acetyltransferase [Ectobacillus ponti]
MYFPKVERLRINYKTLEEFKKFKGCGAQELSMLEDLQGTLAENDCNSPFYGIYYGESLVARMSLYMQPQSESAVSDYPCVELFKLEVLPEFQRHGFGTALVAYAKSLGLPVKTTPRVHSERFWEKQGFQAVPDPNGVSYIWQPHENTEDVSQGASA